MTRTAKELAEFLGCSLEGDGAAQISSVASPASAGAHDLIYVEGARHVEAAGRSAAQCVLTAPDLALTGKTLLRSSSPKLAFARAAELLVPPRPIVQGIHPTALISASARLADDAAVGPYSVIEDNVSIGAGTEVGAFCFLGTGSRVGEFCRLYPRVTLYAGAWLGSRVIVHAGAVIGSDGFGYVVDNGKYQKFPQIGQVEIHDDVEIGANATVDRGSLDRTEIGPGVKLDNLVHVAHNVRIGDNSVIAAQTGISGSSIVGKNVVAGGQVGIADHCRIEDGAVLGAQAGIPTGKFIRGGHVFWGTPARPIERFKEQYAWFSRLPELARRLRELESGGKNQHK